MLIFTSNMFEVKIHVRFDVYEAGVDPGDGRRKGVCGAPIPIDG